MRKTSPAPVFVAHVVEMMRTFGPVEAKSMFGGWGLYHEGLFFALIAAESLYLKTDDDNRGEFEALGLKPFVYEMKDGDRIEMHYLQAPEEALETCEAMVPWARSAYGAALRAAARKPARKKAPKPA
jgi:DNA transformation protein and related proteins